MPIPPAHPAFALVLRRFCPKYLDFTALALGCILPDVAYLLDDLNKFSLTYLRLFGESVRSSPWVQEEWDWDDLSHTVTGSIIFCLPIGLVLLWIVLELRRAWVANLPNPHRDALLPSCLTPRNSPWVYVSSLFLGTLSHVVWDWFSNKDRWLGQIWPFLHAPLLQLGGKTWEVYRVVWMISSAGGVMALIAAYVYFLRGRKLVSFERQELGPYLLGLSVIVGSTLAALILTKRFVQPSDGLFSFLHRWTGFTIAFFSGCVLLIGLYSRVTGRSASGPIPPSPGPPFLSPDLAR